MSVKTETIRMPSGQLKVVAYCPACGSKDTKMTTSAPVGKNSRLRYYTCHACGERFKSCLPE
jgi:transcription elongation factor Elf1